MEGWEGRLRRWEKFVVTASAHAMCIHLVASDIPSVAWERGAIGLSRGWEPRAAVGKSQRQLRDLARHGLDDVVWNLGWMKKGVKQWMERWVKD